MGVIKFRVNLNGDNEAPPVLTQANGQACLEYDTCTCVLSWKIEICGLTSKIDPPNVNVVGGMHIHAGASNVNGPIIVSINKMCGNVSFPKENETDLLNGNTYINVHTVDYPSGEIRGQLLRRKNCKNTKSKSQKHHCKCCKKSANHSC